MFSFYFIKPTSYLGLNKTVILQILRKENSLQKVSVLEFIVHNNRNTKTLLFSPFPVHVYQKRTESVCQ